MIVDRSIDVYPLKREGDGRTNFWTNSYPPSTTNFPLIFDFFLIKFTIASKSQAKNLTPQGHNNVTWVQVEQNSCYQGGRKNEF